MSLRAPVLFAVVAIFGLLAPGEEGLRAATTFRDLSTVGGHVSADLSLATTEDGFPAIAYYQPVTADLYYIRCLSFDCGAFVREQVDSAGDVGQEPALLVDQDGLATIAYRDATPSGAFTSRLKLVRCEDVTCTARSFSYPDTGTSDSVTNAGYGAAIEWVDAGFAISHGSVGAESGVRMVFCDESDCGTPRQIDAVAGRDTSIAINPVTGFPVVAHVSGNDVIRMVICNNANCSNRTQRIFSGTNAKQPSVIVGSDQVPMIAFHDLGGDHLGLIRCANASCDSTIPSILDNVGATGRRPHMMTRYDDLTGSQTPVIGYVSGYTGLAGTHRGDIRLLECGNAACDTGNTIFLVDSTDDGVGEFYDMALLNDAGVLLPQMIAVRSEDESGVAKDNIRVIVCDSRTCGDAPAGPFIHTVEPERLLEGEPLAALVVRGQGFGPGAMIMFAGQEQFSGPINGNEDALVTAPTAELLVFGLHPVTVKTAGGLFSGSFGFAISRQSTDTNCSGDTAADDALAVMTELAGLNPVRAGTRCDNDANLDSSVSLADAVFVLRVVAGLDEPLEVEPDLIS